MTVVVSYAGGREQADSVAAAIVEGGGHADTFKADVADELEVNALFDGVENAFGGIDVVVHAAGIMELSPLTELDLDVLDRMLRVNLRGTFVVDREAARRVRAGGAIINFSSSLVKIALPTYAGYAATKGGVDAITLILARELRGRDITVNAVAPGPTATPLFLTGKDEATVERMRAMTPLERLGTPADVAELVAFLAREERDAGCRSGSTLDVFSLRGRVDELERAGLPRIVLGVSHVEWILCVIALTATEDVSPRVSARTSAVSPRPTTLNTRTTLRPTSASESWRTTFES
jgi:3-oxoacyl-[acyl-carrier protein] reductase